MLAGAGTGKTTTLAARVAWLIDQGAAPERVLLVTFTRRAAREMLGRARSYLGRSPKGRHAGRRGGRHLPLGRPSLRAPPRRRARPAGRLRRARRRRRGRPARPRAPGGGRRADRPALPAQVDAARHLLAHGQRPAPAARAAGRGLPVVRAPRRRPRAPVRRLRRAQARARRASTSTTCCSTGARWPRTRSSARSSSGGDRPPARRRVPGRQRAPGRPRPRPAQRAPATSPSSATTCRPSTASARPRPSTSSPSPSTSPARRWSRSSATTAPPSRCSTSPTPSRRRPSARTARRCAPSARAAARPSSCCASTRPRRRRRSCERVLDARERGAALREQAVLMRAVARLATCSSSSSPAATSRTSSTAGCATSRPRTSRTSWPCCAWPTTRPIASRGFAGCSCSTASGRRPRGACSRRSSPTPAAWSTCSRAGRPRTARSRPRRAGRRTPSSRPWAPRSTSPRPACAPRACATRWPRSSRRTTPTAPCACCDLDALVAAAGQSPDLARFVADLVLDPPASSSDLAGPGSLDEDWLVLSTVHSAKGLEWRSVHVLALYDGNFPSDLAAGDREAIEEERRLLYVALTRAQRDLHLYVPLRYYHRPRGVDDGHGYGKASRFLTADVQSLCRRTDRTGLDVDPAGEVIAARAEPAHRGLGGRAVPLSPPGLCSRHGRGRASRSGRRRRGAAAPGLPDRSAARAADRGRRPRRPDRGHRRQQDLGARVLPRGARARCGPGSTCSSGSCWDRSSGA